MKLVLIGCGVQGRAYAIAAADLAIDLSLCADPVSAAAKKAAALCRARAMTDCNSALAYKEIGGVLLCAPPHAIPGYLQRAAKLRKHVLIASPFASGVDARKALDATRATGVHAYIAHDTRVAPELGAIASQLDQAAIGKPGFIRIVRVGAAPHVKSAAGAVTSLLPADIDWLAARFGSKPRLFAQSAHAPGVDHVSVTMTFADGPIVQWVGTCRAQGETPRASIEICGTAGMIQFTTDDLVFESAMVQGKRTESSRRSSPIAPSLAARHLARFAALVETTPEPEAYDHELTALRLLDAVAQSAATGREIRS